MERQYKGISESLRKFICDGTPDFVLDRYAQLVDMASRSTYGPFDDDVVVVDTEATGLSFTHDELIQIAAARVSGGEIVDWYVTFVNPQRPIPDEIVHLTGIQDSDVADAPLANEALSKLVEFVGTSYVVAHNVSFDRTFTTKYPGGYPLLENVWVDSLDIARIALPHLSSHRLLDLVRAFDCPISTHRADADVEATCAVLRVLLAGVDAMPTELVCEIARLADKDQWQTQVVFQYFADRKLSAAKEAAARAQDDGNIVAADHDAKLQYYGDFSLMKLRIARMKDLPKTEKRDAEAIAQDPLVDFEVPTSEEISAAFDEQGAVGKLFDHYEERPEQLVMAQAVRDAYARSENLAVEAGTGVGKSMGYLVPSALLARKNNISVGVATKTNALLDQLVYHELPALASTIDGLTYAPLKGFSHYPCLRRIGNLVSAGGQTKEIAGKQVSSAPALAALLSFVEQSEHDDIDSLKIDYRTVPKWSITTTSHDCLRRKCPYFGTTCFVHGARRRAEQVDIVVTNHALLFCDMAMEGGLLPKIRYWVIDEAHGAEDEARKAFSVSLAAEDIARVAGRVSSDEASRNPFIRAERRVTPGSEDATALLFALTGKARKAGKAFAESSQEFVSHMKDLLFFDDSKHGKNYEYVELWMSPDVRESYTFTALRQYGRTFIADSERLVFAAQDLTAFLEDYDDASGVQRDVASVALTVKEFIQAADVVLGPTSDAYAYSATLSRKKDRSVEKLEALIMSTGEALNKTLYERTHSVIYSSATIALDGNFDAFVDSVGLNAGEVSRATTLCLPSSFDFDHNMTIYVATDMPDPRSSGYLSTLEDFLVDLHRAQEGSLLTLFTNRREMEQCHDVVARELKEDDLRVVCQKWGVSTKGLRDEFLSNEHLSLFALKSFWEGFDAPGSTLKGVVIPKLPFSKPTDPLYCERASRDNSAWKNYALPASIIDMKQAAGRLIRKADDKGCLVLADQRLISKWYGKIFLAAMPSRNIKKMTRAQIVSDIESNR